MVQKVKSALLTSRELFFQLVLHALVFSFYVFDREHPQVAFHLEAYQFVFFLNYTLANAFISYFLLPRFFYKKKYIHFFAFTALIVGGVIFIEEFLLERIYFPDSRGSRFPGILFSLGQVLPLIFILSGFKFAWDALTKQRELDELKAMIKESELQFLKSQINPHFLFNNLNNLYSYAIENSPKTPAIILELSSVLRYMLYECREKYVSLSKEIEQLKNFTQLSELQIEERGVVNFTTHAIRPGYQIAPLILIVFIENAFKHSQSSQSSNICIDIEVWLSEDGMLEFHCKNNYHSENNAHDSSQGIGLENVKKRLQLLYPNAHQLDIQQTDLYYEVRLSMQLQQTTQTTHYELHYH
ncbi:two-component system LytT family sensor kinase [Catalinimonas alkaloidigena]|uniref:sensor histidine kinase n=1 Tax=Catalinimonas alkaloidigena TaxID=1075417 RepID=UPI00240768C6|nr:histidine kinase [Catalinimonas alkaloidigena]MDF9797952.1 two-component system LytT family sensor kinase [Catalinimonas alkaloidigena]